MHHASCNCTLPGVCILRTSNECRAAHHAAHKHSERADPEPPIGTSNLCQSLFQSHTLSSTEADETKACDAPRCATLCAARCGPSVLAVPVVTWLTSAVASACAVATPSDLGVASMIGSSIVTSDLRADICAVTSASAACTGAAFWHFGPPVSDRLA